MNVASARCAAFQVDAAFRLVGTMHRGRHRVPLCGAPHRRGVERPKSHRRCCSLRPTSQAVTASIPSGKAPPKAQSFVSRGACAKTTGSSSTGTKRSSGPSLPLRLGNRRAGVHRVAPDAPSDGTSGPQPGPRTPVRPRRAAPPTRGQRVRRHWGDRSSSPACCGRRVARPPATPPGPARHTRGLVSRWTQGEGKVCRSSSPRRHDGFQRGSYRAWTTPRFSSSWLARWYQRCTPFSRRK